MNSNCIFCQIIAGEIPSPRVDEDENFICIRDLHPQARQHYLVIPKKHVHSLAEIYQNIPSAESQGVADLFQFGARVAKKMKIFERGYQSLINTGKEGGQTVFHLHLHLLADYESHDH